MKFNKKCRFIDFGKDTDIFGDSHYFLYVLFKGRIYLIHTDSYIVTRYSYLTSGDLIDVHMVYRDTFLTVDYIKLLKKGDSEFVC